MASLRARHCTVSAAGSSMKGHADVEEEMTYLPSLCPCTHTHTHTHTHTQTRHA